jgi:hypothetical protein
VVGGHRANVAAGAAAGRPSADATSGGTTTSGSGATASLPSTTATSGSAPLPAPCTLVTATDVASFFDNAETASSSQTSQLVGRTTCLYNLKVGVQGRQVGVATLNDFAKNNPNYGYPPPTSTIPGLGSSAVLATTNNKERRLTVKIGTNAIEITVDFYDKPIDDGFLAQLAKTAVSRI